MSLRVYNRKRKFNQTPEPRGKIGPKSKGLPRFVVQLHRATRLHHDLRLEFDGVFKSWAVPRGPSLNPLDQRLAVFVEDHPLEYGSFEGIIPKGNYGAGTVMLWDEGTYIERNSNTRKETERAMREGFEKGHLTFILEGEKLNGEFALIKLKKNGDGKAWLLVKKRDEHATYKRSQKVSDISVKTGRSLETITRESEAAGDIWLSKREGDKKTKSKVKTPAASPIPNKIKVAHEKKKIDPKTNSKLYAARSGDRSKNNGPSGRSPMPRKIKPMIATVSRFEVSSEDWIFEPHLDGLRAIAEVEGRRVHLYSKSGLAYEKKFPEIVAALKELEQTVVFDGEIVKRSIDSVYIVYDVLYANGQDLRKTPLSERRKILAGILNGGRLVTSILKENTQSPGQKKKDRAPARLLAKNLTSTYHSGTSSEWLLLPEGATGSKNAGRNINRKSVPDQKNSLHSHRNLLQKKRSKQSPSTSTKTSRLSSGDISSSIDEPRLTNLEKIYFPDDGITKGDLLSYYKNIAPFILPYLVDRPESLNRHPNGINQSGFYQKDMTGHIPRWLKTKRIFSESTEKSIDYVLCQDVRSLLYIANLGCIELNPWFSRVDHLENPDFLVIDLDPDDNAFSHVIEVAQAVHKILDSVGAANFCKTSGATGIHIGVPTGARYNFDEVRAFAEAACHIVAKKFPTTTSIERNPNRRRKKIYLDFMQNRRGQTLAAPLCIRPRPKAPVSMPVTWKELVPTLKPEQFNIGNALKRIETFKDPWQPVLGPAIDLKTCLRRLQKLV